MAAVLLFSSQVAYGRVGNSAMQFAFERLGAPCIAIPSIFLSNRPDYAATHHRVTDVSVCDGVFRALAANGWIAGVRAVVTGYLPSAEHATLAAEWVREMKQADPSLLYVCDPVIGDEPGGPYIDEAAGRAIRAELLPLADIATPNRFELGWLTGAPVASAESAVDAARALGPATVLATSSPAENNMRLANTLVMTDEAWTATVARRERVPHGTGDFLAAVFTARLLQGYKPQDALALATASMDALISASAGSSELEMVAAQGVWADPMPWPIHEVREPFEQPAALTA
ncbi:MAG: pyridoxal kinase [Hyphomicrobiales bacterium]|nr:pyridoxal kinase [Hyphomicrobiales bacterium]